MTKRHPLESRLEFFRSELAEVRRLQPSSIENYEREIRLLFKLLPDSTDLHDVKRHLSKSAPATHLRKLIIWESFLTECPKPWSDLLSNFRPPKLRQKRPIFLTDSESFKLESSCYKSAQITRDRLLIGFALQLGLRISEILNLKFSDIEGDWIRLLRKGGKEQRLPLPPSLKTLLQYWKNEVPVLNSEDWIFPGRDGRPMSSRAAQILFRQLAERAGISKKVSPHALRHTFATSLAAKGASLVALKEILGHQKLSTTERYMHVTPEHLKETLQLLNRAQTTPRMPNG